MYLVNPVAIVSGRAENKYNRVVIAKYGNATPATRQIAMEINKKHDSSDGVEVQQPDWSKPRSVITLKFDQNKHANTDDRAHSSTT